MAPHSLAADDNTCPGCHARLATARQQAASDVGHSGDREWRGVARAARERQRGGCVRQARHGAARSGQQQRIAASGVASEFVRAATMLRATGNLQAAGDREGRAVLPEGSAPVPPPVPPPFDAADSNSQMLSNVTRGFSAGMVDVWAMVESKLTSAPASNFGVKLISCEVIERGSQGVFENTRDVASFEEEILDWLAIQILTG
ncbi:hypothetical protein B0H11DRAFT_2207355 [Mycena galericulata]|nr:hypothetical protein B0H11DRAFT_2207355 [Mycena galericulata]